MILRAFFLIFGYSLSVSGGISMIAYLNLIAAGHGYLQYITFISNRPELYLFIFGMLLIWTSIYFPISSRNND
jgi:hypothetical protein